ncbi:unnamed protein product [Amoebophrya sp. A120]|nr:unnamed protein product [Amoebophrya sp. A120]|eukprot:GSA120T00012373001.1
MKMLWGSIKFKCLVPAFSSIFVAAHDDVAFTMTGGGGGKDANPEHQELDGQAKQERGDVVKGFVDHRAGAQHYANHADDDDDEQEFEFSDPASEQEQGANGEAERNHLFINEKKQRTQVMPDASFYQVETRTETSGKKKKVKMMETKKTTLRPVWPARWRSRSGQGDDKVEAVAGFRSETHAEATARAKDLFDEAFAARRLMECWE